MLELAPLKFIEAKEGARLLGPPCVGKSHCAKALAQLAVQRGCKMLYREARTLGEIRKTPTMSCPKCLMSLYGRSSAVLTSNRPVKDWPKLLGDVVVVAPLLDRLMHRGNLRKLGGKSWRLKEAAERVAKRAAAR